MRPARVGYRIARGRPRDLRGVEWLRPAELTGSSWQVSVPLGVTCTLRGTLTVPTGVIVPPGAGGGPRGTLTGRPGIDRRSGGAQAVLAERFARRSAASRLRSCCLPAIAAIAAARRSVEVGRCLGGSTETTTLRLLAISSLLGVRDRRSGPAGGQITGGVGPGGSGPGSGPGAGGVGSGGAGGSGPGPGGPGSGGLGSGIVFTAGIGYGGSLLGGR